MKSVLFISRNGALLVKPAMDCMPKQDLVLDATHLDDPRVVGSAFDPIPPALVRPNYTRFRYCGEAGPYYVYAEV